MTQNFTQVEHDGLSFRCCVDRAGDSAPWIVFSNSMMTDLTIWDAQADTLRGRFNILRYDQRGHGGTTPPSGPCDFDQLGGDLLALLDHFGIASCTFVGLSMGTPTGLYLAINHPERVTRLVFSDGQSATAKNGAATWQARIDSARAEGMEAVAKDTMSRWFSEASQRAGKTEKPYAAAAATSLDGYIACATALQNYDFNAGLPGIQVPTLLMAGANDGNMPVSMQEIRKAIPGAVMHVIPDAGHIPNHEQPEIFNARLLEFLG